MFRKLTALACTLALVPALALAQQPTKPTSDTMQRTDTGKITQDTSFGKLSSPGITAHNPGLTMSQVKQLQEAINANGCDAGTADGMWNSKTEQGVQCIRREKNVQGNNINDVLKALHLDFTVKGDPSGTHPDTSSR